MVLTLAVQKVVEVEQVALKRKELLEEESVEVGELREMEGRFRMHFSLLAWLVMA